MSLADLAAAIPCDKGALSRIENGKRAVGESFARRVDELLGGRGDLIAAAHLDNTAAADRRPTETVDLLRRIQANDTSLTTLEALQSAVHELCCQYGWRDARKLRQESHTWMREVAQLLHRPVGLAAHRELLVSAGWLALIIGCVEYDLGMRSSAEATRVAGRQLGDEAGHAEIVGWSWEMAAWMALTQGRYANVIIAAEAGQKASPGQSAAVQLLAQEAKARARLGDLDGVRSALDRGRAQLDALPGPARPDHHFVVDPDKWDFYAMDAYRLARDDERAGHHAREVLRLGVGPDGRELAPMRMAEARLTLAAAAARAGELEEAVETGVSAFEATRRSLPSLLMVAGEVDAELHRRYPNEAGTASFRAALRSLT